VPHLLLHRLLRLLPLLLLFKQLTCAALTQGQQHPAAPSKQAPLHPYPCLLAADAAAAGAVGGSRHLGHLRMQHPDI
jgi:hypothetical protein